MMRNSVSGSCVLKAEMAKRMEQAEAASKGPSQ